MKDMRRLATTDDNFVSVVSPVTSEELQARQELYDTLTPAKKKTPAQRLGLLIVATLLRIFYTLNKQRHQ